MIDKEVRKRIDQINKKHENKVFDPHNKDDIEDINFLIGIVNNMDKNLSSNEDEEINYWDDDDKAQIEKK